jgi:hypothetical protein
MFYKMNGPEKDVFEINYFKVKKKKKKKKKKNRFELRILTEGIS